MQLIFSLGMLYLWHTVQDQIENVSDRLLPHKKWMKNIRWVIPMIFIALTSIKPNIKIIFEEFTCTKTMFVQRNKNNVGCYKLQMDCIRKYVCHNILKRDWTRVITHHLKHTFDLFYINKWNNNKTYCQLFI